MQRTLVFHQVRALWWDARRDGRAGLVSSELADGIRAYACRQAHIHRQFISRFTALWSTNPVTADVLQQFGSAVAEGEDEDEDEEEEGEEEPDYDEIVDTSGLYEE
jgi:hypothetical protein